MGRETIKKRKYWQDNLDYEVIAFEEEKEEEDDDDDQKKKMEEFYALVRSFGEARGYTKRSGPSGKAVMIQEKLENKRKKMKSEVGKNSIVIMNPRSPPEDFTKLDAAVKTQEPPTLKFVGTPTEVDKEEIIKEAGLDLKLSL